MTRNRKLILAGVAAAAVGLVAAGAMAQRAHEWGGHKGRQFGHGGAGLMNLGFGGPNFRMCRGNSSEMADHMLVRVEHRVKPTDDQKAAFDEFKTATRSAAEKLSEACPKRAEPTADGDRPKRTAIERLALTQTGLEASLEAMKVFRPAAEKFYATLSDEQKAKVDRRGRGMGHWKRERGQDKDEDGPAPAPQQKG